MPQTLEKKKYKAKRRGEPIPDKYSKIKQNQQQTVIVNINKQKRGQRSSIEKPKEQKEQPKTINQFSFSMPQTQNPIGEYIKMFNKDLFNKIERAIKTKDPVINSLDEPVAISRQAVKELKRIPTPLETIPQPPTIDNFLKNHEELNKPLTIGEPTILPDVTTLDEPESISLDEEPEETKSEETVETLKKVEPTPDLFEILATPPKRNESPIQLGVPVPTPIIEKKRGRPPLSDEEKALRAEIKPITRPVGRPYGSTNESLRARLNNQLFEDTENPPKFASVKSVPRQQSSDLSIPTRIQRRKEESLFTGIEPKSAPQRRASLSFGSRLGSTL